MPRESEQLFDELLVMRWQDGEVDAMDLLVQRWQRRLWQHARRLTANDDGAWEVLQESWLGMIHSVRRLDDPKRFPYWAYRIVTNKACDWIRRKKRQPAESLSDDSAVAAAGPNQVEQFDDADAMTAILSGLSVDHRAVVSLRYVEDFTVPQIAAILGLPEGTIKSRLHYAKNILKQRLS
jgi:RNA polymerase sigma-70 factor (ECF subfamily)